MEYLFTHGTREEQCKKTEIGTIPQSWQIFRLKEVIHVKSGKRLPKGENFAKDLTQYPYIRIVDFMNETVKINALKYLNEETYKKIYRYIITKNDIYISIAGTIGLVGTIPDELDGANLTENAARLVIKDEQFIQKDFVAKFLNSETAQKQIENLTVKTSQPKLALTRIEQIKIPVACYIEQSNIVKILKACDDKITALEHEAELLDELFQALLEQLMTGQLSVVPLIEENKEASP
jgi:type I restriction enzyme S subunit